MYLITKTVNGNVYYWNDIHRRFEGMENNATLVDSKRYDELFNLFIKSPDWEHFKFSKIAQKITS